MKKKDADAAKSDANGRFRVLAEPIRIGETELRNRIVFPAMVTGFGSPEGFVTERCISYCVERARGGVGLIIVEPVAVSPAGRHTANTLLMDDDRFIQMHTQLCEVLHAEGVSVFLQLMHAGRKTSSQLTGSQPVGPSAEADPDFAEKPAKLTVKQIRDLVKAFTSAASRARRAGYDGVELLASGGFLLHQFLSADSNRRGDRYGGDVALRARMLTDVIADIRAAEPELPLSVRLGPGRKGHYHIPLDDLMETSGLAVAAGASCINVALGVEMLPRTDRVPIASPGEVRHPVEPVLKRAVDVPVIGGGGVFDAVQAEQLVRDGHVDMIALRRPLIADPLLPAKLFEGRAGEIRPCIRCNICLGWLPGVSMMCPSNPTVGREQLFWLARRGAGHHVIIVGAGLAGLWSALVAAELGYSVELFEPGGILGNLLAVRSRIPGRTENYHIVDFLSRELTTLGVKVHFRQKPTARDIIEQRPCAVFITHVGPVQEPEIEGLSNVHTIDPVTVLSSEPTMGDKIVLLGGGLMGAELAYYLAKRHKRVALLEERTRVAGDAHPGLRRQVIAALNEMDCPVYVGVHDLQVNIYGELTAQHRGRTLKLLVDTVILAGNYEPCDTSYAELEGKVKEVHFIGDAYETAELTRLAYKATSLLVGLSDRL